LLNIHPAFRFPLVEILNDTTPWHLNVYDSMAQEEQEEEGVEEEEEEGEDEERMDVRKRSRRDVGGSLLASCGGTFRYSKSQEVTKRCLCRLSWLTNSALEYEPKCRERGKVAGS
jgi:hypothetical protein